jgi:hypothetical protein
MPCLPRVAQPHSLVIAINSGCCYCCCRPLQEWHFTAGTLVWIFSSSSSPITIFHKLTRTFKVMTAPKACVNKVAVRQHTLAQYCGNITLRSFGRLVVVATNGMYCCACLQASAVVGDGSRVVDALLTWREGQLAIEVDGPFHFMSGPGHTKSATKLTAATRLRNYQLRLWGIKGMSIVVVDQKLKYLRSVEFQNRLAKQLRRAAVPLLPDQLDSECGHHPS